MKYRTVVQEPSPHGTATQKDIVEGYPSVQENGDLWIMSEDNMIIDTYAAGDWIAVMCWDSDVSHITNSGAN